MDDRTRQQQEQGRQVEIGAGLQESRLNTELIEWLQKWGPRFIYMLLVVVLAYLGWEKWTQYRERQIDEAFAEYQAEVSSENPDILFDVAEKHDGRGSVWTLASLDGANLLLRAARTGVRAGADVYNPAEDDLLSQQERTNTLETALAKFETILARHENDTKKTRFAQEARWGIASAAISLGDIDRARTVLTEYVEVGKDTGFSDNVLLGNQRLQMLDRVASAVQIFPEDQLPEANRTPDPAAAANSSPSPTSRTIQVPVGQNIQINPDGTTVVTEPPTNPDLLEQELDPAPPAEPQPEPPATDEPDDQ